MDSNAAIAQLFLLPARSQRLPDRILHSRPGGLVATQKGGPYTEFNPAKEPMTLLVRLETFVDHGLETTLSIQLLPGPNNIHIPIREIAGSRFGTLDNVRNLFVFKEAPSETEFFLLGSLVLERAGSWFLWLDLSG